MAEHLGYSFRTGVQLTNPPFSAIQNHCIKNNNNNKNELELNLLESLLIKTHKQILDNNLSSMDLKIC